MESSPEIVWNMWKSYENCTHWPRNPDHNYIFYDEKTKTLLQYDYYTEIPIDEKHSMRGVWKKVVDLNKL